MEQRTIPELDQLSIFHKKNIQRCSQISSRCSSYTAELKAILMVLKWVSDKEYKQLLIATDCMSALQALDYNKRNNHLVDRIRRQIHSYQLRGCEIVLIWVPGHCDIKGNEKADKLAKAAASSLETTEEMPLTIKEANGILYDVCKNKWDQRYMESTTGAHYREYQPSVYRSIDSEKLSRKYQRILFRLQTGHCGLRSHLHRIGKADSPLCRNCFMEETVAHFILHCPLYEGERTILFTKVYEAKAQFTLLKILTDMRIMPYTAEFLLLTGRNI